MSVSDDFAPRHVVVHGHRRAYRLAGRGPVILLLHGLGCDSTTWIPLMRELAEDYTVLAPDFLGHGQSDKPIADYSLGGYANGMRDLLTVLGIDHVTVVGHSLGGGVAMQFAYQFPERTDRICLIAAGGLGPEVTPAIRMLTLPGAGAAVHLATRAPLRPLVAGALRRLARPRSRLTRDLGEIARIYESMSEPATSWAVRRVTHGVVDWRRQLISMRDRAYLTQLMPLHVIWGEQDQVLPVSHAETIEQLAPGATVTIVPDSGHFPHRDHPQVVVEALRSFLQTSPAAPDHVAQWRSLMVTGVVPAELGISAPPA